MSCHVIFSCHVMSCRVMSYFHVMTCSVMQYNANLMLLNVKLWHVLSYDVMLYHFMQCVNNLCHVMSRRVMSCHVMSCHVISCHVVPFYVLLYHITIPGWHRMPLPACKLNTYGQASAARSTPKEVLTPTLNQNGGNWGSFFRKKMFAPAYLCKNEAI